MLPQQITIDVLLEKYAKGDEKTQEDIFRRVSKGIASVEKTPLDKKIWEEIFFENMKVGAIGAGRIMSAAGTDIQATLINCFVQSIGDCMEGYDEDGVPGIYEALSHSAYTLRRGGGVGYNFSKLRPKNSIVKGVGGLASGPCSYMDIFDSNCGTIESAGARRGAQMGVLNINHPDIFDFITAKRTPGRWNNFNVSLMVTDAFMKAKNSNDDWELIHKAEPSPKLINDGAFQRLDGMWVYSIVKATELWDIIMKSNYDYAEPGILFYDNINVDNNLRYVEKLDASNPCGEQMLPPYGCCDLGPIILTKFVDKPFTTEAVFNKVKFVDAVITQVRFLDNVLDKTLWPLEQQARESASKRRIGVGYTGLGNMLAMLGLHYGTLEACNFASEITEVLCVTAYTASIELAKERGAFPLFNADKYLEEGTFASRLPDHIKNNIRKHGIRNSHLLSIAPTGTISLAFADNASNGIEPPFSLAFQRKKRESDGSKSTYDVVDHGLRVYLSNLDYKVSKPLLKSICEYKKTFRVEGNDVNEFIVKEFLPSHLVTALELNVDGHINMMAAVQKHIDSAVSKTVNVPKDYPFEDFKKIYDKAWTSKLKGISTYRPNDILGSVLSVGEEKKEENKVVDNNSTMLFERRPEGDLNSITRKVVYSHNYTDKSVYITVSFFKNKPAEIFIIPTDSEIPQEWLTAYTRNLSLLARTDTELLLKALKDGMKITSTSGGIRYGWVIKDDESKVPKFHDSEVSCISYAITDMIKQYSGEVKNVSITEDNRVETKSNITPGKKCPVCNAHAVIKADGCDRCTNCGHLGSCG